MVVSAVLISKLTGSINNGVVLYVITICFEKSRVDRVISRFREKFNLRSSPLLIRRILKFLKTVPLIVH